MKQVTIIGAGFSGLVAAWSLQKSGFSVTLIEQRAVTGGRIETLKHRLGLVETAANGLLSSQLVEELFSDCQIELQFPQAIAKRRYFGVEGRVSRFPLSLSEAFGVAIRALGARRKPPTEGETLADWARRVFGEAMLQKIISPGTLGIYATAAENLSASLIAGRFYDRSQKNISGRHRGTVSANGGLGALLEALRTTLEGRGAKFQTATELSPDTWREAKSRGAIIVATSAWHAAEILGTFDRDQMSEKGRARLTALDEVRSVALASVTVFFNTKPSRVGFGTLFAQTLPYGDDDGILGCLQNSVIFSGRAKPGVHSETWILGGFDHGEARLKDSDERLLELILEKRSRLIDPLSRSQLIESVITRWPRAIPHYGVELETRISALNEDADGVLLFGNYLGDLGLASILERTRDLARRVNLI